MPAFVISVGNITVGGSGKTPAVIMLAGLMKKFGRKPGILSRGYGRSSRGFLLVSDGSKMKATVDESGDEMFFVSEETGVPTAVAERRVEGARRLIDKCKIDTLILDDAYQHRWIARDIDIVMVDQRFLNKTKSVEHTFLPLGEMRESFEALKRADFIIINRKFSERLPIPDKYKVFFAGKNLFSAYYTASGIYDVKSHKELNFKDFQGQKSLVVCGIARPYSFLNALENNRIDIKNKMLFIDHKNYTIKEVQEIRKKFYDTNATCVLTTHKDAVKLNKFSKELDDIDIYYLKIELKIDEADRFEKTIKEYLTNRTMNN